MALEGHGIAFLPLSAVRKELRAKKLVSAAPGNLEMTMDVRVYRERPTSKDCRQKPCPGPVELPAGADQQQRKSTAVAGRRYPGRATGLGGRTSSNPQWL